MWWSTKVLDVEDLVMIRPHPSAVRSIQKEFWLIITSFMLRTMSDGLKLGEGVAAYSTRRPGGAAKSGCV